MQSKSIIALLIVLIFSSPCLAFQGRCVGITEGDTMAPCDFSQGGPEKEQKQAVTGTFHGDTESRIFHSCVCKEYNCKDCVVIFKTEDEALKVGYSPCRICVPRFKHFLTRSLSPQRCYFAGKV